MMALCSSPDISNTFAFVRPMTRQYVKSSCALLVGRVARLFEMPIPLFFESRESPNRWCFRSKRPIVATRIPARANRLARDTTARRDFAFSVLVAQTRCLIGRRFFVIAHCCWLLGRRPCYQCQLHLLTLSARFHYWQSLLMVALPIGRSGQSLPW